jgi:hypothetical protein
VNAKASFLTMLDRLRTADASRVARLGVSVGVAVVTLQMTAHVFHLFNDKFLHGGTEFDETHFVWGGWCITKGLVPYRDFLEFKPPFVFLTHAIAMKLYGYHEFGYRKWFEYFPLASVLALQVAMISRGIDKLLALGLVLALTHLWVNPAFHDVALTDSESIGLSYYLLVVAFLIAKTPLRAVTNALGGALLVACILSKEPFLPFAGLTWIGCFLLREPSSDLRRDAREYVKTTGLGGALVVLALCIYMVPTGAMREYLKMMSGYFRFYRDPTQSYCVVLGRFTPTTPLNDLVRQFDQARRDFLNLTTLGFLVPFGIASVAFIARRSKLLLATTVLGCLFALYAVTASNCQWKHYYNMTMGGLFFFLAVGLDSMTPFLRSTSPYAKYFVCFALLGVVGVHIWPRVVTEEDLYGSRIFPNEFAEPVPGVIDALSKYTMPDDRIFTTGHPGLYVQADRISAVRESAIVDETLGYYDGVTDEEKLSGLRAQLEKNRPKVVIMDPAFASRKVRTNRALVQPFLDQNHYQPLGPYMWLRADVPP